MKRKLFEKILSLFSVFSLLVNIFTPLILFSPTEVLAGEGAGAIWTTTGSCGAPQNVNDYPAGSEIYINADGFPPSATYTWEIKEPGAGGAILATGPVTTDGIGAFCINAGVIPSGGPYQTKLTDASGHESKGDNFSIDPEGYEYGSITVIKNTFPDDPQDFEFNLTGQDTFYLDDDDDPTLPSLVTFSNLAAGTYTVSEISNVAYSTGVVCENEAGVSKEPSQFDLAGGENVTCTFTNTKWPTITVTKYVDPVEDSGLFDLYIDEVKVATDVGNGGSGSKPVGIGTHTVSEVAGTDTNLDHYTAVIGGDCDEQGNVTVGAGDEAVCTITNTLNRGSIQGRKYYDVNANGDFDQEEKDAEGDPNRLDGWTINLYDADWNLVDSMETGDDATAAGNVGKGQYRFVGVLPGTYYVCEVLLDGWTQTEPLQGVEFENTRCHTVTVNPGQGISGIQFGNYEPGTIFGHKYEDLNGDGQDTGDFTPVENWLVGLWQRIRGQFEFTGQTDMTDANGYYSFSDLFPGVYSVKEAQVQGWTNITPLESAEIPLAPGAEEGPVDFVNYENGSMSGHKFNDIDGDGVWEEGEPAILGWEFELHRWNEEEETWDTVDSVFTDAGGNWSFAFGPGIYRVYEVPQTNWIPTNHFSGYYPSELGMPWTSGARIIGIDFGNFGEGHISGHKWNDLDADGIWDEGEPALAGWKIKLDRPEGSDLTGTTNSSGYYNFGDLGPGQYRVYEENQAGWTQTAPAGNEHIIDMYSGGVGLDNPNYDFGNVEFGSITVRKYINPQVPDELQLFRFDLGGDATDSAKVAGWGSYTFEDLLAGEYSLTELVPEGWYLEYAYCGEWPGYPNYQNGGEFTLSAGENKDCTFYNIQYGGVEVTKFNDEDGDGYWDDGEDVLEDWEMTLSEIEGDSQSGTTDEDGEVLFSNLIPGEYELSETLQDNWILTNMYCDNEERSRYDIDFSNNHEVQVYAGRTTNCYVGNQSYNPEIAIEKTNDKESGAKNGDIVTYSLTITNSGDQFLSNVEVFDALPGGFTYVAGTTEFDGISKADPAQIDGKLVWVIPFLGIEESVVITYQVEIGSDVVIGAHTNLASCSANVGGGLTQIETFLNDDFPVLSRVFEKIECNVDSSTVTIGGVESFSGDVLGQVLGASTELPATGNDVKNLVMILGLVFAGMALKSFSRKFETK